MKANIKNIKTISVRWMIFIMVISTFIGASVLEYPKPDHFPAIKYKVEENPYDAEKVKLGRKLFYDPILSDNFTISCASCHSPYNAFAHTDHDLSHGIHDSVGFRNAPPLFNLGWSETYGWDGAVHHLDAQALAPINDKREMALNTGLAIERLKNDSMYSALFKKAFGDDRITSKKMLQSLSQFMLTLVSDGSKYDLVKKGKATFTSQEENGYIIFKKFCNSCHVEPLFSNYGFKSNGLPMDPSLQDVGRYKITLTEKDSLHFKVPSLRNLSFTYPYMHDGRFKKLKDVLNHYTTIDASRKHLSNELQNPIVLTSNEKVDLIAFLLTLDDKEFCFNKNNDFPKL